MGTFGYDTSTGEVTWDDAFEQLLEVSPADGARTLTDYADRIHPDDLAEAMEKAQSCASGRLAGYELEYRMLRGDGSILWVRSNVVSFTAPDGVRHLVGVCVDVTEQRRSDESIAAARQAERDAKSAAEISHRRLDLLAQVSSLLETPPDLPSTLQRVAELAIEVLADWCVVDLVDGGGDQRMAIAHRDPVMLRLAEEVERRWPRRSDEPLRRQVMDTREPVLLSEIPDEMVISGARDQEHLAAMRRLDMSSAAIVPVRAGGAVLGVLSLVSTHGRTISEEDLELAVELGRHAGFAVERARLRAERERVTTALQRALLPPALPTIPGVELAAAYEPAGPGAAVGGDFYDVVATRGNRWWVVLGDVQGKGPEAAAVTGTIRNVLAAILHETDDPADALEKTQVALQNRTLDQRTASVVLATFVAGETPLDLRVASAGHPSPLVRAVVRSREQAADVREVDSDGLLFGVGEPVGARTTVERIEPGEVMLLYTDGATDVPVESGGRLGEAGLGRLVASAPAKPAGVVDTVLSAVRESSEARRDDVALIALGLR